MHLSLFMNFDQIFDQIFHIRIFDIFRYASAPLRLALLGKTQLNDLPALAKLYLPQRRAAKVELWRLVGPQLR